MSYKHNGEAADKLFESYKKDKEPFIIDTELKFPDRDVYIDEVKLLKEIFFPNCWNSGIIIKDKEELKRKISKLGDFFFDGIKPYLKDDKKIDEIIGKVLDSLADIREKLKKDVEAAYAGDPAARSYAEIIRSYPGFAAIEIQRVAHELHKLQVPAYPREIMEHIHSITGIDIHPGATIGEYFFIDHGTGVVIGETTEIGDWVRLYQTVTLGVLHLMKEGEGILKRGYKRHPTIGSHVVVGVGAKILGPVTIGSHVNVGANSWITEDIPDYTTVYIAEHPKLVRRTKGK